MKKPPFKRSHCPVRNLQVPCPDDDCYLGTIYPSGKKCPICKGMNSIITIEGWAVIAFVAEHFDKILNCRAAMLKGLPKKKR